MPRQADWKHYAAQLECKWVAADAVIHEAYQVAECAKEKLGNGEEWQGGLLVDATARILSTYVMTEESDSD